MNQPATNFTWEEVLESGLIQTTGTDPGSLDWTMGSSALESNGPIPPRVPWADAASGIAGFSTLVVRTVVARRVAWRFQVPRPAPPPHPT